MASVEELRELGSELESLIGETEMLLGQLPEFEEEVEGGRLLLEEAGEFEARCEERGC